MYQGLHFQILGREAAPKLVFLHGLMGSAANWRKITSLLEDSYHILVLDQRGHGRSHHPKRGYQPEDYAQDLKSLLDHLGWNEILLVGHSMGGRNALEFTHLWPQRVIKLVLEDIGPEASQEAIERTEKLLQLVPTPFATRSEAKEFLLQKFPQLIVNNPQKEILAQYFYSNIEEKPDGTGDWRFSREGVLESLHAGRTQDRWKEFQQLQVPTLIIRGEHSPDLSREIFHLMLARNQKVKGIEIQGAGHWVHFDKPIEFTQALKAFFDNGANT